MSWARRRRLVDGVGLRQELRQTDYVIFSLGRHEGIEQAQQLARILDATGLKVEVENGFGALRIFVESLWTAKGGIG